MKEKCKYCKEFDDKDNMHKDKYTEEYYHEKCRPSHKRKGGKIKWDANTAT